MVGGLSLRRAHVEIHARKYWWKLDTPFVQNFLDPLQENSQLAIMLHQLSSGQLCISIGKTVRWLGRVYGLQWDSSRRKVKKSIISSDSLSVSRWRVAAAWILRMVAKVPHTEITKGKEKRDVYKEFITSSKLTHIVDCLPIPLRLLRLMCTASRTITDAIWLICDRFGSSFRQKYAALNTVKGLCV